MGPWMDTALRVMGVLAAVAAACFAFLAADTARRWRQRVTYVVILPPLCPWCDDRTCGDKSLCDCVASCGRMNCAAYTGDIDAEWERINGGGDA